MQGVLLLVAGVVLVVVLLKLVAVLMVRRWSETLEFRGPVHGVQVTVRHGEVVVRGSGRSDARVRRRVRHGVRRPRVDEHVEGGVLVLEVRSGVVQYEVDVPTAASVVVRGNTASATVVGIGGPVELRAGAGSLEGRALTGNRVSAVTTVGSIRLSFDRAPDHVDVLTEDGAVELALPGGPYDVEAEPADVRVPCATGARRRVRAHSSHGPVRIRHR